MCEYIGKAATGSLGALSYLYIYCLALHTGTRIGKNNELKNIHKILHSNLIGLHTVLSYTFYNHSLLNKLQST